MEGIARHWPPRRCFRFSLPSSSFCRLGDWGDGWVGGLFCVFVSRGVVFLLSGGPHPITQSMHAYRVKEREQKGLGKEGKGRGWEGRHRA